MDHPLENKSIFHLCAARCESHLPQKHFKLLKVNRGCREIVSELKESAENMNLDKLICARQGPALCMGIFPASWKPSHFHQVIDHCSTMLILGTSESEKF